jgi:hypothetical protein
MYTQHYTDATTGTYLCICLSNVILYYRHMYMALRRLKSPLLSVTNDANTSCSGAPTAFRRELKMMPDWSRNLAASPAV